MSKFSYFPGCSLEGSAKTYQKSLKAVCQKLDIELEEIPDWNCCGATPAKWTSNLLSLALSTRNLILAEKQEMDVIIPCAACYNNVKSAQKELEDEAVREKVNKVLSASYQGTLEIKSLVEVIHKIAVEDNFDKLVKPLKGLKIASYYGCLLTRPQDKIQGEDPDNPQSLDEIFKALGAEIVNWFPKTKCCGASFSVSEVGIVIERVNEILKDAKEMEVDLIVTACPLCQSNLDMRQLDIKKRFKINYKIPAPFFTDILGVAMGIPEEELTLNTYFIDPRPTLRRA